MTKPPVMRMTISTSRAPVPAATRMRLLENRKKEGILLLPLGRQRPLGVERLLELVSEEGALHAAVDDVPRQHFVGGSIAEDEEIGVNLGFGNGRAPVAAVALRGFDRRRDAAVAQRQQRLV